MAVNIKVIQKKGLCISCGLCAATCPVNAIVMHWHSNRMWFPQIETKICTNCGICYCVCPNTPERINEYASEASKTGERFGLSKEGRYFISYATNSANRIRSASGGALTVLLSALVSLGKIDGVISSVPISASLGKPHYEINLMQTPKALERSRSSHYFPLCYDKVLHEIQGKPGKYALVGLPCIIRGIKSAPLTLKKKIAYTFSLSCSHNVTGQFLECLAKREGIREEEPFLANLRDKIGIPDANNFNTYFKVHDREIRRNRFKTAFTDMWRNYFFAFESCLYCPDFYGVDADLSVKDAWGRLSSEPLGITLFVVRNPALVTILKKLRMQGMLFLESCNADEIFQSQPATPRFKHVEVGDRLVWKPVIRRELLKKGNPLGVSRRLWSQDSHEYWRLRFMMYLSKFFYVHYTRVPVKYLILLSKPFELLKKFLRILSSPLNYFIKQLHRIYRLMLKFIGLIKPFHPSDPRQLRVLISGGYGYGNVGDEAQLAANIDHWRTANPNHQLTVLTPDENLTQRIHKIRTELAPRVVFFNSDRNGHYSSSSWRFKLRFFILTPLLFFNVCLMRSGLPVVGITARQAKLLDIIKNSDLLFLSGGGYLTGMTISRLWDNMLLIRIAHAFGIPAILSGQTIGIFKDFLSPRLAKWGLKKAKLIYLRDQSESKKALQEIGINRSAIETTFDDALYLKCESAENIKYILLNHGVNKPYLIANIHYWGQHSDVSRITMKEIATALDLVRSKYDLPIVFVAMIQSDIPAIQEVIRLMQKPGVFIDHESNVGKAVGIIRNAALCLTMKHHPIIFAMGGGVPTVAIALDDYYMHKNRGALKIFAQDEFVISCRPDELSQQIVTKLGLIWRKRKRIAKQILLQLNKLKPRSGEIISRWLEQTKQFPSI